MKNLENANHVFLQIKTKIVFIFRTELMHTENLKEYTKGKLYFIE